MTGNEFRLIIIIISDAGDTGGEGTGPMSTGMIFVSEDQSNIYDKFSPKVRKFREITIFRDQISLMPFNKS